MFRRLTDHTAARKTRISLVNMRLIDIPPCESLVFVKFKQGRRGDQSQKFPIVKSTVCFTDPLLFDYEMGRHSKPLRLSFRFENPHNARFTRYGVVEIDVMQRIIDCNFAIRILLSDCSYNTYFTATLHVPGEAPFPRQSCPAEEPRSLPTSSSSSSASTSDVLYSTIPMAISRETFDRLEREVDLMLADVLTNGDIVM
jgi:hypothetical protein